jgi:hypothetical protein
MKRAYAAWLVICTLAFAQYGCAVDAGTNATGAIHATDATNAPPTNDPTNGSSYIEKEAAASDGEREGPSSARSAVRTQAAVPNAFVQGEVVQGAVAQGPQPVPWCEDLACGSPLCGCVPGVAVNGMLSEYALGEAALAP